jgi:hypothetical protein
MLSSENVSDDDVVEKAGDGLARVRRDSIAALALSLVRAIFHTKRRVGRHRGPGVVCASLCVVASERACCSWRKILQICSEVLSILLF